MTAQIAETLFYEGQKLIMFTEPLQQYLELAALNGEKWRPSDCGPVGFGQTENSPFVATNTANWRGYHGYWEILADRLYLRALAGTHWSGRDATIDDVFPGSSVESTSTVLGLTSSQKMLIGLPCGYVFAHWFTGRLRCPRGNLLKYQHSGYESKYEEELLLDVEGGCLAGISNIRNTVSDDDEWRV